MKNATITWELATRPIGDSHGWGDGDGDDWGARRVLFGPGTQRLRPRVYGLGSGFGDGDGYSNWLGDGDGTGLGDAYNDGNGNGNGCGDATITRAIRKRRT